MSDPLKNKRIVVTRSQEQAITFGQQLAAYGANPIIFPVIQFTPLPTEPAKRAIQKLSQYNWLIFTSSNAVRFFHPLLPQPYPNLPPIAASGSATARLLQQMGFEIAFIPDEFVGEALVAGLGNIQGKQLLLPRARIGRPKIAQMMRERGAIVDDIALYDTITATPTADKIAELQQGVDILTFTSPSSVRNFLQILNNHKVSIPEARIACIGPITADEAQKNGLPTDIMPSEYTITALTAAIVNYYQ